MLFQVYVRTFLVALSFRSYCQTMFVAQACSIKYSSILTSKFYYSRTFYMCSKVHETGHCLNFGYRVDHMTCYVLCHVSCVMYHHVMYQVHACTFARE